MKQKLRSYIVAPKGYVLLQADFSQAETWIVAHLAEDDNMKKALMYGDIHTETAGSAIFFPNANHSHGWIKFKDGSKNRSCEVCGAIVTDVMRYTGKKVGHGTNYGMGGEKQAESINKESDQPPFLTVSVADTKRYRTAYLSYYGGVEQNFWAGVKLSLSKNRTLVNTYGRVRQFNKNWGEELFKEGYAHEPQSTVADHANGMVHPLLGIPGGFLGVYKDIIKKKQDIKMVNQAHDSCILEMPYNLLSDVAPQVKLLLQRPLVIHGEEFTIPVDLEYGECWGELSSYKEIA